jgi:hypothetical protein
MVMSKKRLTCLILNILIFFGKAKPQSAMSPIDACQIKTEEDARNYAQELSQRIDNKLLQNAKKRLSKEQYYKGTGYGEFILQCFLDTTYEAVFKKDGIEKESDIVADALRPLCVALNSDAVENNQRGLLALTARLISSKIPFNVLSHCAKCKKLNENLNSVDLAEFNGILTL